MSNIMCGTEGRDDDEWKEDGETGDETEREGEL